MFRTCKNSVRGNIRLTDFGHLYTLLKNKIKQAQMCAEGCKGHFFKVINQSINQFIISNFSINIILPADNLQYYTLFTPNNP